MKTKYITKKAIRNLCVEFVGSFLIAIGIYNFAMNANFPMTGFSGISIILYRLFNLPVGATTIILNIPVAILCYRLLGRGFFLRSMRCMVISSLLIDWVAPLLPVYEGGRMLAAICTGVFAGFGYAMIYMINSSTGGADFIIMSVKAKKPYLSLGKIAFLLDVGIILAGGIIFRDMDGIIYGMIINFLFSIVVDKVMYGINSGKMTLIVTQHGKEVAEVIDKCSQRGSTIINALGGYQQDERQIVMCACNNKEMYFVEQAVKEVDPKSFLIILESSEVHGEGFKTAKIGQSQKKAV